jgi:hypothetical protein
MNRPDDLAASRLEKAAPTRSASDELISIADIRGLFKLGRTAAHELTHRPGFLDHVEISPRCYRWWASDTSAEHDLHEGHRLWPYIRGWAAELGLTGHDAVAGASQPPGDITSQQKQDGEPPDPDSAE